MGLPSKIAFLAAGYGIAKLSEAKVMQEVVELTKLGSDQLFHNLKSEINLAKDELNIYKEKLKKKKEERDKERDREKIL